MQIFHDALKNLSKIRRVEIVTLGSSKKRIDFLNK